MYFYRMVFVPLLIIYLTPLCESEKDTFPDDILHRNRRQLLFPNVSQFQFNAGVATPTAVKTVNVNYAFQANFMLPWNRTQIPIDILEANAGYPGLSRKKRDSEPEDTKANGNYESDSKLYYFYKYVEEIMTGYGYNGSSCVLRALCQLGAEPLHSNDEEDLLHEITTFVLNPKHDVGDDFSEKDDAYPYVTAYKRGENSEDCIKLYECSMSLIDVFSKLHDVS